VFSFPIMAAMLNYWMLAGRSLLLFGMLPIFSGSLMGLQGWLWNRDAAAFAENLREVDGHVLRILPVGGELLVDVEYLTDSGMRFEKQLRIDTNQESGLRSVRKVSLIYDVRYPQTAELGHVVSAHNEKLMYMAMTAGGIFTFLWGLTYFGIRTREALRTLSLFRSGALARTEVRDVALAPGTQTGRFAYAFRGPDGRWYDGRSPEMGAALLSSWPVGKQILVAFNPANPRQTEVDIFGVVDDKRRDAILTA